MSTSLLVSALVVAWFAAALLLLWLCAERAGPPVLSCVEKFMKRAPTPAPSPPTPSPPTAVTKFGSRPARALALLEAGRPCSELILAAYAPSLGLSRGETFELGLKLARKVNMTETCGAVTGAWIVLCKQCERCPANKRDSARAAALETFTRNFQAHQGTTTCRRLLGPHVCQATLRQVAGQPPLPGGVCPKLVREAAELLDSMLN